MKVNNHKYIESFYVEKIECGVIVLTFKCNQEELYFHRYTNENYLICGTEREFEESGWGDKLMITVPNFIDDIKKEDNVFMYLISTMHDSDTVYFYFTPYKKDYLKTRKLIIE